MQEYLDCEAGRELQQGKWYKCVSKFGGNQIYIEEKINVSGWDLSNLYCASLHIKTIALQ